MLFVEEKARAYAKQVGESLEVQNDICEIKLRAERKMGEMLKEMPKNKGKLKQGKSFPQLHDVTTEEPTLKFVEEKANYL